MYIYKVKKFIRVVDGDTVDLEIDLGFGISVCHRVRLKGINCPEIRTLNHSEKQKGMASKAWLEKHLFNEKQWEIKTEKDDKYGRFIGTLICEDHGGVSINEQMVLAGMAVFYPKI